MSNIKYSSGKKFSLSSCIAEYAGTFLQHIPENQCVGEMKATLTLGLCWICNHVHMIMNALP